MLLAHLVDGFVEGLDDVEPVQDQLGVGTVPADGADSLRSNAVLLGGAEMVAEERVDGFPCLALADPHHAGAFQFVDQGLRPLA